MLATMADAHREWHTNTGIPMGTPGCPQDACHPIEDEYGIFEEMFESGISDALADLRVNGLTFAWRYFDGLDHGEPYTDGYAKVLFGFDPQPYSYR